MLAVVDAYRTGLLNRKNWLVNLSAGLIVAIVALPLAMAFAIAIGAKPEQGLYTAIIAAFCVGMFGGSRVQIAGPTGAFIVILANITAQYGIGGLQIATLIAGFILILMGLTKLGNAIKFIPDPVIVGFTAGIGFIIFFNEWKDFFGLPVKLPLDASFYQKFIALITTLPHLNLSTTGLALLSLFIMWLAPKFIKRIPSPLLAMISVTTLQLTFHFDNVATIGNTFGVIPQHLPHFNFPNLNFNQLANLISPAFTIALLGAIESLLSATAADGMTGQHHDSNQELIGQGVANIFAPLFGGFAATGAIARTATNVRHGGNSPLSAITHSLVLILIIILLAPLASYIPLCSLAAILFVVALNMSDIPHFMHILKHAPLYDSIVLLVTFLLTIFTDLVTAVNIGVVLAMLFFILRMNRSVTIELHAADKIIDETNHNGFPQFAEDVLVYSIHGPFFFGAAEKIEHALTITNTEPKVVIFRLGAVPFIDMTGLETFNLLLEQYHKKGVKIYLCEANVTVAHKLFKTNIAKWVHQNKVYKKFVDVLDSIHNEINAAE